MEYQKCYKKGSPNDHLFTLGESMQTAGFQRKELLFPSVSGAEESSSMIYSTGSWSNQTVPWDFLQAQWKEGTSCFPASRCTSHRNWICEQKWEDFCILMHSLELLGIYTALPKFLLFFPSQKKWSKEIMK